MRSDRGFTLVELLMVIATIGVLASLGIISIKVYRAKATYSNVEQEMGKARVSLEDGIMRDPDHLPASVSLVTQKVAGPLTDGSATNLMPSFQLSPDLCLSVSYDPDCVDAGCVSDYLEIHHHFGDEYETWTRFGDGLSVPLEHLAGSGCP